MATPDEYSVRGSLEEIDLNYRDVAAVDLYIESGGKDLVKAAAKLNRALVSQAAKLEEFYNTPFTEEHTRVIETTVKAIERIELLMERWHFLIYPNQKPRKVE